MKKLILLNRIMRITGLKVLINGFVVFYLAAAFAVRLVEPDINSYGDALWFLFASFTTIGYGDITAVTFLGRTITVITSLYGILIVAFIPAVIIGYYNEFNKIKAKESLAEFLDKLEHLPALSKEELENISKTIRDKRYRV